MTAVSHRELMVGFTAALVLSARPAVTNGAELWLHPKCKPLPTQRQGPFVRLPDGGILGVDVTQAVISRDEGKTWETHPIFAPGQDFVVSRERVIVCTKKGTVIVGFMNYKEKVWKWNAAKRDADPGTKLPTYVVRSTDGGRTWLAPQRMHDTWTGDSRDMIQAKSGRVIFSSMNLLHKPGRHSVLTYTSDDDGKTWTRSNTIDLGGNGHHGGVTEATIEQLRDGRIWMLIRTNWERFWEAISADEGRSWRIIRPSKIPASSSPGLLKRLASGRLVLIWNRPLPEGKTDYPRVGGKGQWSEVPVRNHRGELSIMFSEDDGKTWSKPVVFAKKPGTSLAYPHIFEVKPGVMWVTTMQGNIRVILHEADFLAKASAAAPEDAEEPVVAYWDGGIHLARVPPFVLFAAWSDGTIVKRVGQKTMVGRVAPQQVSRLIQSIRQAGFFEPSPDSMVSADGPLRCLFVLEGRQRRTLRYHERNDLNCFDEIGPLASPSRKECKKFVAMWWRVVAAIEKVVPDELRRFEGDRKLTYPRYSQESQPTDALASQAAFPSNGE